MTCHDCGSPVEPGAHWSNCGGIACAHCAATAEYPPRQPGELRPGDRLVMTEAGIRQGLAPRGVVTGLLMSLTHEQHLVILRDGYRSRETYHPKFWRRESHVPSA